MNYNNGLIKLMTVPLIYTKFIRFSETCNAVRNAETWRRTTMQAARSHVTTTCTILARTNCNHGFSISHPQGDRDFANCLARATVRISSRLRLQRFGDKVSVSRVSVSESENRTRLWSLDKIRFSLFFFGSLSWRKFSRELDEALLIVK